MSDSIVIVEDEEDLRETISDFLRMEGYEVSSAGEGRAGLARCLNEEPDLIILDMMLPGMSGLEICRKVRERGYETPILFLTVKRTEADKLEGFDAGADDYLTKPFSLRELAARLKALLRRARAGAAPIDQVASFADVTVNFSRFEIDVGGEPVRLSAREMELLAFLIKHRGQVLSRDLLLEKVWHYDADVSTRTVDTHIHNLRRKLKRSHLIETVHGVGYKFAPPEGGTWPQ